MLRAAVFVKYLSDDAWLSRCGYAWVYVGAGSGASANKVPSKLEETRKSLQEMQRLARTCRRARVENLEESKASLKRFCTTLLQRLRVKFSRCVLRLGLLASCLGAC